MFYSSRIVVNVTFCSFPFKEMVRLSYDLSFISDNIDFMKTLK